MQNPESRHVCYDADLNIEAYHLTGVQQPFPNHFHSYYVIGFIEGGRRQMLCSSGTYFLAKDDVTLFAPGDHHACKPLDDLPLDYRALNIPEEEMRKVTLEITGQDYAPKFKRSTFHAPDLAELIHQLYTRILSSAPKLEKEEAFFLLLCQILMLCTVPNDHEKQVSCSVSQLVCGYLEAHYQQNISLDDLSGYVNMSKYHLLRTFTRDIGVSPYRYLQSYRIEQAKKLLAQGIPPAEAADHTGFSDQSHFSKYFKEFIGFPPGQYQSIFQTPLSGGASIQNSGDKS